MLTDQALADHLADSNTLPPETLEEAVAKAASSNQPLGDAIASLGLLDSQTLGKAYSTITTLPYVPISKDKDPNALEMICFFVKGVFITEAPF